jgi:peptidoglycan/xylan/chitin deacetylase (PgdA/CDA1 family)
VTWPRRWRILVASASLAATLSLAVDASAQLRWIVERVARRAPQVLYFVQTDEPVVALSIDDGPDASATPGILAVLAEHDARATFFVISGRVPGNELLLERLVAEGHELGNHMTSDTPSIALGPEEFERRLLEAHAVLSNYAVPGWFRPGSGWFDGPMLATLARHDYRCALGSVYPFDAQLPWSWFAARYILWAAQPGSIIVLHDGGNRGGRTARTLSAVLPELARRGLRVTTLSELAEFETRASP